MKDGETWFNKWNCVCAHEESKTAENWKDVCMFTSSRYLCSSCLCQKRAPQACYFLWLLWFLHLGENNTPVNIKGASFKYLDCSSVCFDLHTSNTLTVPIAKQFLRHLWAKELKHSLSLTWAPRVPAGFSFTAGTAVTGGLLVDLVDNPRTTGSTWVGQRNMETNIKMQMRENYRVRQTWWPRYRSTCAGPH